MTVILGMETPDKNHNGKTDATVKYRFYYEKIWNITITANSPKPGECSYRTESLGKTPAKSQHPPVRVYDPAVQPHTCGSVRMYACCTESIRFVRPSSATASC